MIVIRRYIGTDYKKKTFKFIAYTKYKNKCLFLGQCRSSFWLGGYGGANSNSNGSGQEVLGSREEVREGVDAQGLACGGEGA